MSNLGERALSRRELLRAGAVGAAAVAAGSIPGVARAAQRSTRRVGVTKGGTLVFARSIAPTKLDPANSIIAGDVYTLDKIFEPLYITSAAGKLTPWLATGYTTSTTARPSPSTCAPA